MRTKKIVEIIQDLYALKKIIQEIKEKYIKMTEDDLAGDAYSIVIDLIGELEEE